MACGFTEKGGKGGNYAAVRKRKLMSTETGRNEALDRVNRILEQLLDDHRLVERQLERSQLDPSLLQVSSFHATSAVASLVAEQIVTTIRLTESSHRLEGLTKKLNLYTWALIILTALLVAADIYSRVQGS